MSYKDLKVWQRSLTLLERVYGVSRLFPDDERFSLTQQVCRAAVSIPSNIAEGYGRGSTNDYIRMLWFANGSLAETETQLLLASRLGYVASDSIKRLAEEISELSRMLRALIASPNEKGRS